MRRFFLEAFPLSLHGQSLKIRHLFVSNWPVGVGFAVNGRNEGVLKQINTMLLLSTPHVGRIPGLVASWVMDSVSLHGCSHFHCLDQRSHGWLQKGGGGGFLGS